MPSIIQAFVFHHSLWWSKWSSPSKENTQRVKEIGCWMNRESSNSNILASSLLENNWKQWMDLLTVQLIHGLGGPFSLAEALLLFCNEITERKQPCLQLDHCYVIKRFVFVKGSIPRRVLEIELKKYPEKGKNCLGRYCTAFFILRAKCILKICPVELKMKKRAYSLL